MADRGFSSTIETALSSHEAAIAVGIYLDWVGGAVRLWSGNGTLVWSTHSWLGAGKLGSLDKITDSVDRADIGIQLGLNYLDDTLRNEVMLNNSVGRDAAVFFWLMDPVTVQVIDGYEIFTGFIDRCEIEDAGATGSLTIRLASELAKLKRPRFFALSDAHQQHLFPLDRGCGFATKMNESILWGRKPYIPWHQDPNWRPGIPFIH